MLKRVAVVIAVMLLLTGPAAAQTRSVFWERWDVVIEDVDTAANSFVVTEIYDVSFSGTFRFGSALIPPTNLEDIRDVQVYEAGQPLRESCSEDPGTYCVRNTSDGKSIVYYFNQPITNSRQRFSIKYTVVGALRVYEGGDQLWWTAIPEEHYGFSIGSSAITVTLPSDFAPREGVDPVETYGVPANVQVNGSVVTATATRQLGGSDFFEIRVQYPHNPAARVARWQPNYDNQRQFEENVKPWIDLGTIALTILIGLGGPLALYALWYTRGRDPKVGPVPEYLSEPPSSLPPAIVGTLVDERADLRDVLSTLIDLARRGFLVIEETRTSGLFGLTSSEFVFKRTDQPLDGLRGYEKRILNRIFGSNMERSLSSLKNVFYQYIPELEADLYNEMLSEGFFTTKPSTTRSTWVGIGTVVIVFAVIVGGLLSTQIEEVSQALICIPFSIGITGVLAILVGQVMPAKTRKGAEEAAKWNAFLRYLHNLEKYSKVEEAAARFDEYLPYAVAFGMDRSWVRRFSKLDTVPIPPWYYPTYRGGRYARGYTAGTPIWRGGQPSHSDMLPGELARAGGGVSLEDISGGISGGLESISKGLTDMLESASRTFVSRPQQTSGSSGRWSSGGRSWSGGGSRGGGSSGGGRRGFG